MGPAVGGTPGHGHARWVRGRVQGLGRVSTVCSLVGSDVLVPFLVGDLYVNEEKKQCEESLRCVDRLCPLNRTTWKSFWASHGMTTKRLPPKPGWWTHKRPYPVGRGEE